MARIYLNNAKTKLTATLTAGATSCTVTAGDGALFAGATGGDTIRATLVKISGFKEIAWEIVDITARSTDTLTITRAQESTTALDFAIGDLLDVRFTKNSADAKAEVAGSASQDFAVKKLTAADTITPHSTKGIVGTTTNDDAQAGSVGEYIISEVVAASAVALTTSTFANVTSISLTPGDWDVVGNTIIQGQASTTSYTRYGTGISLTSVTGESPYQTLIYTPAIVPTSTAAAFLPTAMRRITVASGTTTVYLLGYAIFTAGTASAYGFISARRVR